MAGPATFDLHFWQDKPFFALDSSDFDWPGSCNVLS